MIIIGITGSIGMGKSTIAKMLRQLKIPVFDSDKEVKDILDSSIIKKQIYDLWPDVIYTKKSVTKINTILLSDKIFSNRKNRKVLERIIHPHVQERRNRFINSINKSYVVALDVPLLFETGTDKDCDYIFLAHTNEETQRERVLARPSMTEKKFNLIKKAQWSNEKKRKKNPYLVTTSYGKFISFILIIGYLIIIILKRKVFRL